MARGNGRGRARGGGLRWPALLALARLRWPWPCRRLTGAQVGAAAPAVRVNGVAHFGGNFQPHTWVPVTVELANDGANVTGEAIVEVAGGRGQDPARYSQRVELPARAQKAVALYAFVPDGVSTLGVSFKSGKEAVAAAPVPVRALRQGQRLIGAIGDDARAGGEIARALLSAYGSGVEAIPVAPGELPGNPYGLASFSALVVSDATTGRWSEEQRGALAAWVAQGGRLVVAGGADWRKTVEGLGELPPVRLTDARTVAGLNGLARLAGARSGPSGNFVVATGETIPGARRLAEQDGVALVAARDWGRGEVNLLAFDPAASDFVGWAGAGALWKGLGLDAPTPASLQRPFTPAPNPSGYGSSAAGARNVSDILRDLPSLSLPPTWLLLLVMLLFIAVVGPVNYLVLRRLDRRELAWLTIPALTILCAGAIYGFGATTRGRAVVVNSVSVVRIAPDGRLAEAQSFYGVFTPSRGARQLGVGQPALLTGFSSDGLGDGDLGGDVRYEQGAGAAARDAYFAQWTLRQIAAQAIVDPAPLALELELRREGGKVVGQITNPSGRQIEDLTLVFDGAYHQLGFLAAGASVPVDWAPAPGGGAYAGNLGTVLYAGSGSPGGSYSGGSYSSGSTTQGTPGRRLELLNALSGSVIAYGRGNAPAIPPYAPYGPTAARTPTPTPTPRPGGGTPAGAQPATGPLQVLYWTPEAPLPLNVGTSDQEVTTLIIQELDLDTPGAATGRPAEVAGAAGGGGR